MIVVTCQLNQFKADRDDQVKDLERAKAALRKETEHGNALNSKLASLEEKLKLEKTQATAFGDKLAFLKKQQIVEQENAKKQKSLPGNQMGDDLKKMLCNMGGGSFPQPE